MLLMEISNIGYTFFQKNFYKKTFKKYRHNKNINQNLTNILAILKNGKFPPIEPPYSDHALRGKHKLKSPEIGKREVKVDGPGFGLVYSVNKDTKVITLWGIGTHNELDI